MAIKTAATLLEREHELAALTEALDDAQAGGGRLVLLEAPAGLGKTTLLAAAMDAAGEAGFTTLRARASDLERDFAYGCIRQLLDPYVARLPDGDHERLFAGSARLSEALFAPSATAAALSADRAFSMLHGLYWLLNNIADDAPVALCVDDLHWADTESLRFLSFLTPRLDGLAVAILGTARPGEPDAAELNRLAAAPESRVLRPRPLSADATATVCELRLGGDVSPEFARACRDATGGNPFLLESLLHEASAHDFPTDAEGAVRVRQIGPAAVARAIVLRLSGQPPTATALVRAVAILGDGASVTEAAELADLTVAEAARAADILAALAILEPADRLGFAHPIVREAIYADIGSRERAAAHGRAANVLAASGAPEQRIAAQLVQAEPTGDSGRIELLRRVAADALARGAPEAAAAWLRRALAERPPPELRGELLVELTSAQLRLGAPEAAVEPLTEAARLVKEPVMIASAIRLLGSALTWSRNANRAVEAIGHAIDQLEGGQRELRLLLEAERAAFAQQGSLETRAPVAERLARYADLPGDTPGERLVLAGLAFENARASERESEAAEHVVAALGNGRLVGEQETDVAGTIYLLALSLIHTDALEDADRCMDDMLADAHARGSIPAQAFVIVHRGSVAMRRGAVAHAEADARTAFELLTTHEIALGTRFALSVLVPALMERGELEEADRMLRDGGHGREIPAGMASNPLLRSRGLLHLAQGRAREAVEDLTQFGRNDELFGAANPLATRWRSEAALAHKLLGEPDEARRLAVEDLDRARRWGAESGIGIALRALALVDDSEQLVAGLREAVDVLERSPARLEHARALTDLGAALRRTNRRSAARGALREGLRMAERCGARALVARARTELRAAGGRSSDRYGTGVEQLTASEQRVAELAAQGLSNPEIAQTLFVTRKTIETHLGHVYRKLDIPGRGKLAHALAESVPDR